MSKVDPYQALRHKEFVIFVIIRFCMVMAWTMQFIIIEWQVYSLTKDPLSLGIIGLMEVIPAIAIALFAGHIVDRREKKGMLIKCILAFSVLSLMIFMLTSNWSESMFSTKQILWLTYSVVFFGGFVRSFIGPTMFSLIALIVPRSAYANAATWSSTSWQLATVLGPTIAGFSISWIGVHWSLSLVLAFSLFALMAIGGIETKPIMNSKMEESLRSSLSAGIKYVFKTKEIFGAISLDMIAVLFGGAIALLPIYAQDILHVGSRGFGFLRAAPAVGAAISFILAARYPLERHGGLKLLIAIFGFGLTIIVFGFSTSFILSLIALFFYGFTDGISMVIRQTILQLKTPDDMRGRVSSVNSIFTGSSNELGAFESGVTAKLMGTVTAVVFGGCMTIATVAYTYFKFPIFRSLHLNEIEAVTSDD